MAGGDGEDVNKLEDEETGEGATEVGDSIVVLVWKGRDESVVEERKNVRSKKSHICASDCWVCYLGVERGNGDEHDCVGESGEDVLGDYCQEIPRLYAIFRKYHNDCLCRDGCYQSSNEGPTPDVNWWVGGGPTSSIVT